MMEMVSFKTKQVACCKSNNIVGDNCRLKITVTVKQDCSDATAAKKLRNFFY